MFTYQNSFQKYTIFLQVLVLLGMDWCYWGKDMVNNFSYRQRILVLLHPMHTYGSTYIYHVVMLDETVI